MRCFINFIVPNVRGQPPSGSKAAEYWVRYFWLSASSQSMPYKGQNKTKMLTGKAVSHAAEGE
jgi:hypothetical protein